MAAQVRTAPDAARRSTSDVGYATAHPAATAAAFVYTQASPSAAARRLQRTTTQASAGARSAPTSLLHLWKAAVAPPRSPSMQLGRRGGHIAHPRRAPPFVRQRASPTSASDARLGRPAWDDLRARPSGRAWTTAVAHESGRNSTPGRAALGSSLLTIVPSDGISAPAVTAATRRERRSAPVQSPVPRLSAESHMDRSRRPVPAAYADAGAGRQSPRSRAARRLDVVRGGNAARPPGGCSWRRGVDLRSTRGGWVGKPGPRGAPRALRAIQTVLGSGSWPICASRVMTSTISHSSSILPSRQRLTVRPVNSTSWSVTCRPRMVNRVAT